jgi:WD40 repeat protein
MDPALIEEYHQQLREQQSQFNDCVCVFTGALEAVLSLQTHQDVFYYGSHDGPVRSFNLKNGRRTQVLRGHTSWVNDILIGDNRLLYSCSRDGDVRCWDLEKEGECVKILSSPQVSKTVEKSPRIPINCMGLHNNGSILATGGSDGNVLLWNVNSETIEKVYTGHGASISAVKFRGNHLFSSSWDCFAKVVDIETDQVVSVIKAGNTPIKSLSLSKEEKNTMVLGCNNGSIYVYDTRVSVIHKANHFSRQMTW